MVATEKKREDAGKISRCAVHIEMEPVQGRGLPREGCIGELDDSAKKDSGTRGKG